MRDIQRLNERELELGLHESGSWHDQYKDSAYIYVGGLPYALTEGDVLTIFSQYGEIVNINLPKAKHDKGERHSRGQEPQSRGGVPPHNRGFGFLMYEDQRSTVLAVDNLNGTQVLGRTLRVDHVGNYKQEKHRTADGELVEPDEQVLNCAPPETIVESGAEEEEDLEDPMAAYLADEKKRRRKERAERHHREEKRHRHRHREDRHRDDHDREDRHRDDRHRHGRHRDEHDLDDDYRDHRRRHGRHRDEHDRDDRHRHPRKPESHSSHSRYTHPEDTQERPPSTQERPLYCPSFSDRLGSTTPPMDRHVRTDTP